MSQTDLHHTSALHAPTTSLVGYVLAAPSDYELIPVTGAVVILAGILIAAFCSARLKRSAAAHSLEILSRSAQLAEQITQLAEALAAADARVAALAERLDEQSRSTQGAAPTSYNVAIRLARSGASRQELITTCGVTQQEADLVLRLHAAGGTARSAA
jgi:outer membrane murein-binding lipoprotein Lpp